MLRSTFLHLGGIGPVTEADLWQAGIDDWHALEDRQAELGFSAPARARLTRELAASERAFAERDAAWCCPCPKAGAG